MTAFIQGQFQILNVGVLKDHVGWAVQVISIPSNIWSSSQQFFCLVSRCSSAQTRVRKCCVTLAKRIAARKTISQDPVVRRGDKFIARINHATPRINFILGLNCIAQSGDKFILGINGANPGIKLTQRLSRVKFLSCCFFVMKHYVKQFCRYTCFSNNNRHFSFSNESQFLSQGKENITK